MYSSLRLYFEVHSRAGFESQAGVSWSSALALLQAIYPLVDMIQDYYDSQGVVLLVWLLLARYDSSPREYSNSTGECRVQRSELHVVFVELILCTRGLFLIPVYHNEPTIVCMIGSTAIYTWYVLIVWFPDTQGPFVAFLKTD